MQYRSPSTGDEIGRKILKEINESLMHKIEKLYVLDSFSLEKYFKLQNAQA